MRARRKLFILCLGLLLISIASSGSAQVKTRDATVGVIGIRPLGEEDEVNLVDLSLNAPADDAPYLYTIHCSNCQLKVGTTYKAKMLGTPNTIWPILHKGEERINWELQSVLVNGSTLLASSGSKVEYPIHSCDGDSDSNGRRHWVWKDWGVAYCVPGPDPVQWKPNTEPSQPVARVKIDKNKLKNIPACHDYPAFHDIILNVVISVKPAPNHTWRSEQIPSLIAGQVLNDLNDNKRNIIFKEASGELPNFLLNVVVTETNEGTRQDTATVEVKGPPIWGMAGRQDEITLFTETSGESPYISGTDAVYHLSINLLKWFEGGWHTNPPCLQPDGNVRSQ